VKELMDAYGVCYYDAPAEADQLCAYFVNTGKAWACMSDDMDMFLYGCSHVIRNLSLMKQTVVLYDTHSILKELKMTERQFCEIMVLSGTDYNINSNTSLTETVKWFHEYDKYCMERAGTKGVCDNRRSLERAGFPQEEVVGERLNSVDGSRRSLKQNANDNKTLGFYVWLVKNTKYIKDFNNLLRTYQIFQTTDYAEFAEWHSFKIIEKPMDIDKIKNIMKNEGFIFTV
jgi:5'-3' exonuclease